MIFVWSPKVVIVSRANQPHGQRLEIEPCFENKPHQKAYQKNNSPYHTGSFKPVDPARGLPARPSATRSALDVENVLNRILDPSQFFRNGHAPVAVHTKLRATSFLDG